MAFRTWLPLGARRVLVYTHRWLGIFGCLLFAAWFVSGVVLMYAGMPRLTPEERRAALPALDLSTARVSIADAATHVGGVADRVRVGMVAGRPVYRLLARGEWTTVFADDGRVMSRVTASEAVAEAARFAASLEHPGDDAQTATGPARRPEYAAYVEAPDQWTLEIRGSLPLHRVALGGPDGREVYVSERTGEVVLDTSRGERRIAYAGAILHWLYFTPFRRQTGLWAQTIIWTSILGSVMCLTGLVWGIWRYSPIARYRLKQERFGSPYAGWMRWHHYAGLLFGLTSFTWIFSGLLSMDPWDWHPGTTPLRAQRDAFSGGRLRLEGTTPDALREAVSTLARGAQAARRGELELVQFRGETYLASAKGLVSIANRRVISMFDEDSLEEAAHQAMPGAAVQDAAWLERYDAYYYNRAGELPLPVYRVRYKDDAATWLYVDPRRGAIVRKEERLTRVNRWLYHGLHSLDFPFLYYRRPLWDVVVIVLSIGGLVSTVTTIVPALKRIRRRLHL